MSGFLKNIFKVKDYRILIVLPSGESDAYSWYLLSGDTYRILNELRTKKKIVKFEMKYTALWMYLLSTHKGLI